MKYLITGATGFIGRELCRQLKERGREFIALSRSGAELPCGTTTLPLDLGREPLPSDLLSGVSAVIHLAGIAHQRAEVEDYRRVNLEATVQLARAASQAGVSSFVFLSSIKAMGPALSAEPRSEEECGEPLGEYARSKRQAEQALGLLERGSMSLTILRPALVYDTEATGNLHSLAIAVRRGLPRPPQLGARSMISRHDLVQLLLVLAESPPKGLQTWIASDGEHYSTRRISDAMRAAAGRSPARDWWPLALWRLACGLLDLGQAADEANFQKLFGTDLYSNEALLDAGFWYPKLCLEQALAARRSPADVGVSS